MIFQFDKRFAADPRWNSWGCNLSLFFWFASMRKIIEVSPGFMTSCAQIFEANGWIDKEFSILDYNRIYNYLGLPVWYHDEHTDPNYVCKRNEFEHLYFTRTWMGEQIGHFVAGDGHGVVTYDPYGISNSVKYGHLLNKRIMTVL